MSAGREPKNWGGRRFGNRLIDSRAVTVDTTPMAAFSAVERIGGKNGWYAGRLLWTLRGWLDLLVGGVGMRRGRRDPVRLAPGDVVDFWRVAKIERDRLLLLAAEMKLPGRAWLEFEVKPRERGGGTEIRQTAMFDPHGLLGLAYWYALWPLHGYVFAGKLRGVARQARVSP
jgi:hypothetical protein